MATVVFRSAALVCAIIVFSAISSVGQESTGQQSATQEEEFSGMFPEHEGSTQTAVVGGRKASTREWPATMVIKYRNTSTNEIQRCTGTVIGPRTVLTAAHCMKNNATVSVTRSGNPSFKLRCTHHPQYLSNATQDFALCVSNNNISGFRFEKINTNVSLPIIGSTATILGFGCVLEGGVDESFGVLHQGNATVVSRPSEGRNYVSTQGGAAVCTGDSGGGAYFINNGQKYLLGVASRGDLSRMSRISAVANQGFLNWLNNWRLANGAGQICGIDASANMCRNGT